MTREKVRVKIADIISDKLPEDPSFDEFLLIADEILSISELAIVVDEENKEYFVKALRLTNVSLLNSNKILTEEVCRMQGHIIEYAQLLAKFVREKG